MNEERPQLVLKPIAVVRSEVKEMRRGGWEEVTSEIVFDQGLEESLEGVEDFSHIIVIYWMHHASTWVRPPGKIHPRGRAELPLVGTFATRSPYRPNPLGVCVARLLERRGNVLIVAGLDAMDGTPVLDIKPFMPPLDSPPGVRVPPWVEKPR